MNRIVKSFLLAAAAFALFGGNSLKAQQNAIVNVPFAFHIHSQVMPAGTYSIGRVSNTSPYLFRLADWHGHSSFIGARLQSKVDPTDPKLVFTCYKGACSLAKIDLPGSSIGYGLDLDKHNYKLGMASEIAVKVR